MVDAKMEQRHSSKIRTCTNSTVLEAFIITETSHQELASTKIKSEQEMNMQKYNILPAIGSISHRGSIFADSANKTVENPFVINAENVNNNSLSHRNSKRCKTNVFAAMDEHISSNRRGDVLKDPRFECEQQLEIAIRLPDGSRCENFFTDSSTFMDLIQYLLNCSKSEVIPRNCEFVTSEVPRKVFSDFHVTLSEANIKTRTLLYLREVDPD